MNRISVRLSSKRYEVLVGDGNLNPALKNFRKTEGNRTGFIFADRRLTMKTRMLRQQLESEGWKIAVIYLPVSESLKDFQQLVPLYKKLLKLKANRHSVLFALGGGVMGDLIGFVAATFLRGIDWVSIPTTLLAQVDSGIGGKTGVNFEVGKNLIGAFHQPTLVINDLQFLDTLDIRDRISGLGEMIKYGLVFDPKLFEILTRHWKTLINPSSPSERLRLKKAITQCVRWKAQVVEKDERDRKGIREVLNFGHTFGHALEASTQYQTFRHGEAIILGMRAASRLSWKMNHLSFANYEQIENFLRTIPIPSILTQLTEKQFLSFLKQDKKKSIQGTVRFVLLKQLGSTVLNSSIQPEEIIETFRYLKSQ